VIGTGQIMSSNHSRYAEPDAEPDEGMNELDAKRARDSYVAGSSRTGETAHGEPRRSGPSLMLEIIQDAL